jgi:hypothetical protein
MVNTLQKNFLMRDIDTLNHKINLELRVVEIRNSDSDTHINLDIRSLP